MIEAIGRKVILLMALFWAGAAVQAQTVTIGLAADITSMDPHYHLLTSNQNVVEHVFNRLIERDDQLRMVPGLALSWRTVDPLTWEFKLRPNVKFHDGSPFTADDVAFSIERIPTIKDSPGSFAVYTKAITNITVVDPLTIRLKTAAPYPLLPAEMGTFAIVSKKAATGASSADFNSGKAAVGTGPYKLVRYARGDKIELVRNESFWGKKPQIEKLTFKVLTNDAARVAALLSNDVQVIDGLPVADINRLSANTELTVVRRAGTRLIFLNMDQFRDQSPFVTDKDGKPMTVNPLKDARVRHAISKAIDREQIRTQVMEGASRPTGQLMIPGLPGYSEALKVEPVDIEGAKKLLAEAGYPNGFGITIHGPNNRYVQDDQILQTVAQMLSRVGIKASVAAQPSAMFFPGQAKHSYSLSLSGWGSGTFEGSSPLRSLLSAEDKAKGFGAVNAGKYYNAKMEEVLQKALVTLDESGRDKLLAQATEIVIADQAIIPIHHQVNLWATRKNIVFSGRADERTYAFDFVLQP
ncbi:MAG: ABC transporter substrate-binding protein [Rhizobacter sp.]